MNTPPIISPSTPDTQRFGFNVARGKTSSNTPTGQLSKEIATLNPDFVIFRCPAGDTAPILQLNKDGYHPLHADTLVYYRFPLSKFSTLTFKTNPHIQIQQANKDHLTDIENIAQHGFAKYISHYQASPVFSEPLILQGYIEWAKTHLLSQDKNKHTWIACLSQQTAGFATCLVDEQDSSVDILLNAVHPDYASQGIYSQLLYEIIAYYSKQNIRHLIISTQVWNFRVQNVWMRLNFELYQAFDTYHLNLIKN